MCSSFSTFCSQPSLPYGCFLLSICACLHSVWRCLVSSAHRVVMVTFQACLHHPFSLTRHLSHTHILSMGLFLFLFYFTTLSCYNNNKEKITKIYKYDHPLNTWAIDATFLFFNVILVILQLPNYWVAIKLCYSKHSSPKYWANSFPLYTEHLACWHLILQSALLEIQKNHILSHFWCKLYSSLLSLQQVSKECVPHLSCQSGQAVKWYARLAIHTSQIDFF